MPTEIAEVVEVIPFEWGTRQFLFETDSDSPLMVISALPESIAYSELNGIACVRVEIQPCESFRRNSFAWEVVCRYEQPMTGEFI